MAELIVYVPLFPLIGFAVLGTIGQKMQKESLIGALGTAFVAIPFLIAAYLFFTLPAAELPARVTVYQWIATGSLNIELKYLVDQLSLLFTLIITGVGSLIHIYSAGYMHGDRSFARFFAYLNLFVFMMLNLVLADNFLVTFLGWEGVGLASYLLIGFWYDRKFEGTNITWTGDAAKKAFIANRFGDFGMIIGMFLLYTAFGSLSYIEINQGALQAFPQGSTLLTAATLLIFLGCTGKSAQLPLYVWLPDAMAGPTSVSALIHAATMVTSGIFLIARNATIFALSPDTMLTIAVVGTLTALFAATMGLVQNDIKKVLAYSTVSQLGFMFAALGVGAFTAGVFHVMTHAFFKALLFLGSGSVIHGMHEEQNIQKMGGLKKYMPVTYMTFLIGSLAIAGVPGLSGFFSKDEILWFVFDKYPILWALLAVAALCTAFYMFRLVYLTFFGEERFDHHHVHPHESPGSMTLPLIVLAVLSAGAGYLGIAPAISHLVGAHNIHLLEHWLEPIFAPANRVLGISHPTTTDPIEYVMMGISVAIGIGGIFLAKSMYGKPSTKPDQMAQSFSGLHKLLFNKYWVDELYYAVFLNPVEKLSNSFLWKIFDVKIIDGVVNGSATAVGSVADVFRRLQSGVVQNYALVLMFGIIALLTWMVIP